MENFFRFYDNQNERFVEIRTNFGDLHRNIENLEIDEQVFINTIIDKLNSGDITSIHSLNKFIDGYLFDI